MFLRKDLRSIREDELAILYAVVHKRRIAPVQCMINQWLENIKFSAAVEYTSLVTRIANGLGVMTGKQVAFLTSPRYYIDESYWVQGHTLKHGVDNSLMFFFRGYTNEIPLPNPGYHLYSCEELTIPLQKEAESSRRRTRQRAQEGYEDSTSSPSTPPAEPHWASTGDAPGWTQGHSQPSGSGSAWPSASTSQWPRPPDSTPSFRVRRSTSSRGDFGELTQRMDTLDIRTEEMSQNLMEHVAQTQDWQHHADAQFSNFNNMMQQQRADL